MMSGQLTSRVAQLEQALAPVEIIRKRGRIAGFADPGFPVETLWCGTNRPRKKFGARKNGWSFPPAVREVLLQQTQGHTVLHLFGGLADFGFRMDIDPATRPHVIGNAWAPPFARDSFDDVVLDPPYMQYRLQEIRALLRRAIWIARRFVWWFGTCSIIGNRSAVQTHFWMVRIGDQCATRCLQQFTVREPKCEPRNKDLVRGEGLKYRRWTEYLEHPLLPFSDLTIVTPPKKKVDYELLGGAFWCLFGGFGMKPSGNQAVLGSQFEMRLAVQPRCVRCGDLIDVWAQWVCDACRLLHIHVFFGYVTGGAA